MNKKDVALMFKLIDDKIKDYKKAILSNGDNLIVDEKHILKLEKSIAHLIKVKKELWEIFL
jgi:hypothetical protein